MKKNKKYPIKSWCFYRLDGKKRLCELLLISQEILKVIIETGDQNYRNKSITKKKPDGTVKTRQLQIIEKKTDLYKIHKRIAFLLTSIETNEYLFSGVKGKSYIDNTKFHITNSDKFIVKLDLKDFFPSVTFMHIFSFFKDVMQCRKKVATILAKLSTYNNHLPTGTPLSMAMAYYANKEMFDKIDDIARNCDCKMSLWVDDIVISGDKAKTVSWEAKRLIYKQGLKYHNGDKFKIYRPYDNKEITGNVLTPQGELRLRNRSQKKIYELRNKLNKTPEESNKLKGCLNEARQIESRFDKMYQNI
jgi:hypothetical protein